MAEQHVLITGGAGFIGSNLANHLVRENDVTVVDNEYLGTAEHLDDDVRFLNQSVLDDSLPTAVDAVVHLAALSSYAMHETDPCLGARVNVEGFVNTVDQARRDGCSRVVYASTSSIYGTHTEPTDAGAPVAVNSAYEASKLARERYAEYFHRHYGMELVGLRLYSVYQGFGRGEDHKGRYANVIAQFAESMHDGEPPVLYGDGSQTRDFVHVDDVVRAIELAIDRADSGVYNVGTGAAHSFNEVVELINQALGSDIEPEYVENPIPTDVYVHDTCADASRFAAETGWSPSIDLTEGIQRVCEPYISMRTQEQQL